MTYKKMSMLYTYHLEYIQELIFQKIAEITTTGLAGGLL